MSIAMGAIFELLPLQQIDDRMSCDLPTCDFVRHLGSQVEGTLRTPVLLTCVNAL
jgi:hypothetical protein